MIIEKVTVLTWAKYMSGWALDSRERFERQSVTADLTVASVYRLKDIKFVCTGSFLNRCGSRLLKFQIQMEHKHVYIITLIITPTNALT